MKSFMFFFFGPLLFCLLIIAPDKSRGTIPFAFWKKNNELSAAWTPQWANVKGYWQLDGPIGAIASGGVANDYFSSGSNATASATGLSYVAGLLDQGVSFTSGTYFSTPQTSQANICSNITVMYWVKWNATSATSWGTMAGNWNGCSGNGWSIQQQGTNKKLEFSITTSAAANQAYVTTGAPLDGTWRHLAVSMSSGGAVKIYIDGAVDTNSTFSVGTGVCSSAVGITFGRGLCGDHIATGAIMDEIAIFNVILTDSEVSTIYNRQKNGHK